MTPASELADRYNRVIVEDLHGLGLAYDLFTRTTTRNHYAVAQELFRVVHRNGYMIEQTTTGRDLAVDRPHPARPLHRGHLPDLRLRRRPRRPVRQLRQPARRRRAAATRAAGSTARSPSSSQTQHFFLDLPALADTLGAWLQTRTDWRPNVLKFSLNLLDDVRPRAMTRDIDWGIPVPLPGWEDNPAKRLYVWFDAVIGYLSASIEWARRSGDDDAWRAWWNDPDALSYYFMGKDNITFHSQIWPAELLGYAGKGRKGGVARGLRRAQPADRGGVSSEFLTMEGKQFSSSRGVVIYVRDMLARYQPDALRYFIAVAGPENQDTDFTWSEFVRRTNDELVAGWGNLVNRTASMINKNLGAIPERGELADVDRALLAADRGRLHAPSATCCATHRQKAGDRRGDAGRRRGEQVPVRPAPWKLQERGPRADEDRAARRGAGGQRLPHRCSRRSCRTARRRCTRRSAAPGTVSPMPEIREVDDLDGGPAYPVLMGDYRRGETVAAWAPAPIVPGTPVPPAVPDLPQARRLGRRRGARPAEAAVAGVVTCRTSSVTYGATTVQADICCTSVSGLGVAAAVVGSRR